MNDPRVLELVSKIAGRWSSKLWKRVQFLGGVLAIAWMAGGTTASAQTFLHYWNFNNTASLLIPTTTPSSAPATLTVQVSGTAATASDSGQGFAAANVLNGDAALTHLRINNPTNATGSATLFLKAPTTGYRNVILKYETRRSTQGAAIQQIDYTTDGTTYSAFQTLTVADANPVVVTLDFSALSAVENNANFGIRIKFVQSAAQIAAVPPTGLGGNNRFDNITVSGTLIDVVTENTAPTITSVANQTVDELATLKVSLSAADADIPAQALTFSKVTGPSGLTVSSTGLLLWTPTLDDGPNSYPVTVQVTDNGSPAKSAETSFTVTVSELLPLIHAWNFNDTASVSALLTPSTTVSGAPATMSVSPESSANYAADITFSAATDQGVFGGNRVSGEAVGAHLRINNPLTPYTVRLGIPTYGYRNIIVKYETRRSSTGAGTQQVDYTTDGTTYVPFQTVTVQDPGATGDVPVVTLDFSGIPAVENNLNFGIRISFAQGAGSPGLVGNNRFDNVTVRGIALPPSPNTDPTISAVADQTVDELATLKVNLSAVDADIPGQTLTFSKVDGPAGLTVSASGLVQWTPTLDDGPASYPVTVRVTDSGAPPKSAETSFAVSVTELFPLVHAWNFNDTGSVAALLTPSVTLAGLPAAMTVTPEASPNYAADVTFSGAVDQGVFGANGVFGDAVGSHLRVNNPMAPVPYTITARMPTLGFRHIVVKYETRRSTQGAGIQEVAYTVNGLDFTPLQTITVQDVDGSSEVPVVILDFTGIPAVENNPNFGIQITFAQGAGGTGGNNRFDNLTLRGIALPPPPENSAPVFVAVGTQTVEELSTLSMTLRAIDPDLPAQTLHYELLEGPAGMTVGDDGLLEWTPSATAGPQDYTVRVRVTDDGSPSKSGETSFTVTVQDFLAITRLRINEVMSSNLETLLDFEEDPEDWIELVNPTTEPVNLSGVGLSDNPALPFLWVFPNVTVPAGGYVVVFASGKNLTNVGPGLKLHTNFKISSAGESIVLTSPDGTRLDLLDVPALPKDVAYGRIGDGFRYLKPGTPGAGNQGPGFEGVVPKPALTVTPGYFANPVDVGATLTGIDGATLRYTTNGDEPSEDSPILSGSVTFSSRVGEPNLWSNIPTASNSSPGQPGYWGWNGGPTAEQYKVNTLRVRAFKPGLVPSTTVSGTYIVDPNGASRYQLPVVSIMADYDSLFDPTKGLFVPYNYNEDGIAWERPAHMEIFENASLGMAQNIGLRIHGNFSRNGRMKSLRLYARSQYGPDSITYPIFPERPSNLHERLLLRSGGTEWGGVQFRDAFAQSLLKDISNISIQSSRTALVFINGEYYGIEEFRDRFDDNYLKIQFGVADADLLEDLGTPSRDVKGGSNEKYIELINDIKVGDLNDPGRYDWIKERMDVENFRDYHIAQTYYMNADQPGKNVMFWRSRTVDPLNPFADGRFRWLLYDIDISFGYASYAAYDRNGLVYNTGLNSINATTVNPKSASPAFSPNTPEATLALRRMLSNLEFRADFITRFSDLLNTVFSAPYVQARLGEFKTEVEPYMAEQIARWGEPQSVADWNGKVSVIDTFAQRRPDFMRQHLREFFGLGSNQTVTVNISGSGKVKVNSILVGPGEPGIPTPAFPWVGNYFAGLPVRLQAIPAEGFRFTRWMGQVPSGSETNEILTMELAGNLAVRARFEPIPVPEVVHYWSFNDTANLLVPTVTSPLAPAVMTITPATADTTFSAATDQGVFGGNAVDPYVAGAHLRLNNPLSYTLRANLPSTGYQGVVVQYEVRRSGQGPGIQQIDYTTDGTTFLPFRTDSVLDVASGTPVPVVTLDFSGIPSVEDNPLFAVRVTFARSEAQVTANTGLAGNVRIDNVTLRGIPITPNRPPVLGVPPNITLDEQVAWSEFLAAEDVDYPVQTLTYELVSGPDGLEVLPYGEIRWTPSEVQGGSQYTVTVRVSDDAIPPASDTKSFTLTVNKVNSAPVLTVADQILDELTRMSYTLTASDVDLPQQTLVYSLVSGPAGLTVSPGGLVSWIPTESQGPGTYAVSVRVTDDGSPSRNDTRTFSVAVNETPDIGPRTLWQIGTDENPLVLPYSPTAEFSVENRLNDAAPGKVTRLVGDPLYVAATNPTADDDFYTAGQYPAGFNGLTTLLVVPNDEPAVAWERAHTHKDLTNRMHFVVDSSQVVAGVNFRLSVELLFGGSLSNGVAVSGFADHDMVVRVRNGAGGVTQLLSQRVSTTTLLVVDFPGTVLTGGANTIEIVRTGPSLPNMAYYIQYDFLRLEMTSVNTAPSLASIPDQSVDELTPLLVNLSATDSDVPKQTLTYEKVSGPDGLLVGAGGQVTWTPTEAQGPGVYTVVVSVKDNGAPSRSDTKSFAVTVNDVNSAPVLTAVADQTVEKLTPLVVNLAATDTDVPVQTLSYEKVSGPEGLVVSAGGQITWTPTEAQGPGVYTVTVSVIDNGSPSKSDTKSFLVGVNAFNSTPTLASVVDQTVDELTPLVVNLTATDIDVPAQTLSYEKVNGPDGLLVSAGGQVTWTPTEAQGPGVYTVTVRVKDNGAPSKSDTKSFAVTVNDVNTAPVLTAVADQTVDELIPMVLNLTATDTDLPLQTLTYEKVSGPEGLVVSVGGQVTWTPTEAQGPGTYTVVVQVKDNGTPVKSDTKSFVVTVNEVPDPVALRTVWQIGTDNNPGVLPYSPSGEFSVENRLNDLAPGKVTRLEGDPLYVAATNPAADDDFYTAGRYPAGFNGLTSLLVVPNDEPAVAWERAHTHKDLTNRMHFVVDPSQVGAGTSYRLSLEMVSGGSLNNGVAVSGFADHDMVVRVRNGAGGVTQLLSQRVSAATLLVVDFPGTVLTGGANTIEIVRTGPSLPNVSYWIQYDFLRLEVLGGATVASDASTLSGGSPTTFQNRVAASSARSMPPLAVAASTAGNSTGAVDATNPVQIGVVVVAGLPYRTLTYTRPDPAPVGVRYIVEGSSDAWTWSELGLLATDYDPGEGSVVITVRDSIPLTEVPSRVLRLRTEQETGGGSADGAADY